MIERSGKEEENIKEYGRASGGERNVGNFGLSREKLRSWCKGGRNSCTKQMRSKGDYSNVQIYCEMLSISAASGSPCHNKFAHDCRGMQLVHNFQRKKEPADGNRVSQL